MDSLVNMLKVEMNEHLKLNEVCYEVSSSMTRVFPEDEIGPNDVQVQAQLRRGQMARKVLRAACRTFYVMSKLRIDPGVISRQDYYYKWDEEGVQLILDSDEPDGHWKEETESEGSPLSNFTPSVVIHIKNPRVLIHLVNCSCLDRLKYHISSKTTVEEAGTLLPQSDLHCLGMEALDSGSPSKKGPAISTKATLPWMSVEEEQENNTFCGENGNVDCYTRILLNNLKSLAKRMLEDAIVRPDFLVNSCSKGDLTEGSMGEVDRALSDGILRYTSEFPMMGDTGCALEVLRLIENGMDLYRILSHFGWKVGDMMDVDYRMWCNCPCDLKVYQPNELDVFVVNATLEKAFVNTTFPDFSLSEDTAEAHLEDLLFLLESDEKVSMVSDWKDKARSCIDLVKKRSIRVMLYRVLTRCRRIYMELPSKVSHLAEIHHNYTTPNDSLFKQATYPVDTSSHLQDTHILLKYFNYSFLHHIAPKNAIFSN